MTREEFKKTWAGRKFKCMITGEEFEIPETVHYGAFYEIGDSFVDVGDGHYCRWGGMIKEIKPESGC